MPRKIKITFFILNVWIQLCFNNRISFELDESDSEFSIVTWSLDIASDGFEFAIRFVPGIFWAFKSHFYSNISDLFAGNGIFFSRQKLLWRNNECPIRVFARRIWKTMCNKCQMSTKTMNASKEIEGKNYFDFSVLLMPAHTDTWTIFDIRSLIHIQKANTERLSKIHTDVMLYCNAVATNATQHFNWHIWKEHIDSFGNRNQKSFSFAVIGTIFDYFCAVGKANY